MASSRRKVITPVFRVCFPSVFTTAKPMESDSGDKKPKYEVTMVFPDPKTMSKEERKKFNDMKAILDEAAMELFKKKTDQFAPNMHRGFRDGAEKEHLDGFGPGTVFAKASSFMKPQVVDSKREPILDADDFYPGCYARASVTAYAYSNRSKGVAFGLNNLKFVRDGDRLDSRTDAAQDFGEGGFEEDGESSDAENSDLE